MTPVAALTTFHAFCNLQMGPISLRVCTLQAFPSLNYKENEMTPVAAFTTLHLFRNFQMGPIKLSVCPRQAFST
jgi:hypothetical protein